MIRPKWEVADVIRLFGEKLARLRQLTKHVRQTLEDLMACRTAALGGHADACDACGTLHLSYNSCGNRHCGKCQGVEREAWILSREQDLLPVIYYHVAFNIAVEINALCLYNPRTMYGLLFDSAWQTLQVFGSDQKHLGANTGATMVLHIPTSGTGQATGPKPEFRSAYTCYCAWWWPDQRWEMAKSEIPER